MTSPDPNIIVQPYGRPLSTALREWWASQEDLVVSLTSNETTSKGLGLERLARMIADNPTLLRNPAQARAALVGSFIAHGVSADDAIRHEPEFIARAAPMGLQALTALLLPMALRCSDADIVDPPPADLVSACLLAKDAQALDRILSSGPSPPRTINGLPWVHHAAITGKSECLKVLLLHGCNPHELDAGGNTAMHNAATPEVVKILMAAGVDATITNNAGNMPAQRWGQRTKDRAKQEAMLSVLLSSSASTLDPVKSFFGLAQSNNMGRLKSFAKKLGVDYSIRHDDQGLVFNAALRLAREALKVTELSPTVPQEARVASSWLGFLVENKEAAAATTAMERQGVIALADALAPAARPLINFHGPSPSTPDHLRHLVLELAKSMLVFPQWISGPSTQVRQPVQRLFVGAVEQALDADDANSVSDAVHLANFAFDTAASTYLHKRLSPILTARLNVPAEQCDDLMLAACKSLHEATRHTTPNDTEGFAYLSDMLCSMRGRLDKTSKYIDDWLQSPLTENKKSALKSLSAFARAHQMRQSTDGAPSQPALRF